MIKTVLFDLDGTFADTAPDLAFALNRTLLLNNKLELSYDQIRPVVSHGARALIELGFGVTPDDKEFAGLREQLLDIYANNICQHTRLFDGMTELLEFIRSHRMNWGIVTNKPGWLTEPLLKQLGVIQQACSVVSGDTLPQRKPDPAPLLLACHQAGSAAAECVYVGDAERDIVAGNRAGMHTLIATFGYIGQDDAPETWGASALVDTPHSIMSWIAQQNQLNI